WLNLQELGTTHVIKFKEEVKKDIIVRILHETLLEISVGMLMIRLHSGTTFFSLVILLFEMVILFMNK
ncbi:hypothetical protein ACJX0J_021724, partial [Zea mays]